MTIPPERFATRSLRALPRGDAICQILAAAIQSADARIAIRDHLQLAADQLVINQVRYELVNIKRVFVIGAGKAVSPMAIELWETLGNRITSGLIITKLGHLGSVDQLRKARISIIQAAHPIPDQSNLEASSLLVPFLHNLKSNDLVICLISGGGSALLVKPSAGIGLDDLQITTQLLLRCGADIGEINTIRRHLDDFKGGGLANLLYPAQVISLIISDVVGDDLHDIASGPTTPDPTTYQDAWSIIDKYQLTSQIPTAICTHIQDGMLGKLPETHKPGDPIFTHVSNFIIGSNPLVASAAQLAAKQLGFSTHLLHTPLQGEASSAGQDFVKRTRPLLAAGAELSRPACLIAGGETTVTIHGNGKGGRNQEFALAAVKPLSRESPLVLVSLATDGGDGPTDAAGAVVTNQTLQYGLSIGLNPDDYLSNNDSYHYFDRLGDLIKIGPTLTNVNDLVFCFAL